MNYQMTVKKIEHKEVESEEDKETWKVHLVNKDGDKKMTIEQPEKFSGIKHGSKVDIEIKNNQKTLK